MSSDVASAPTDVDSSPVDVDSSPVDVDSAPVDVDSAPVDVDSAPVDVDSTALPYSQEEITHRVELEYRLFLSIDSSLYRPKTIFFRGCAKFRPLAFF